MAIVHAVKLTRSTRYPEGLTSHRAREFFKHVLANFVLEKHHVTLLEEAVYCLQRAEAARMVVDTEGAVYALSNGKCFPHPLITVEVSSRALFARLCRELGLDLADADTARPSSTRQGKAKHS
jgi:hypothetical protein